MAIVPFVLVVADHDNHTFCVEGPMIDDNPWSARVVAAQQNGSRDINCSVPGGQGRGSVAEAAKQFLETFDYTQLQPGSIA